MMHKMQDLATTKYGVCSSMLQKELHKVIYKYTLSFLVLRYTVFEVLEATQDQIQNYVGIYLIYI